MMVITVTYLMMVIPVTYLMKVIPVTYPMKVITVTYLIKVITVTYLLPWKHHTQFVKLVYAYYGNLKCSMNAYKIQQM
jgi:hypothetical protein